jgi:hypothetical protein
MDDKARGAEWNFERQLTNKVCPQFVEAELDIKSICHPLSASEGGKNEKAYWSRPKTHIQSKLIHVDH